MSNRCPEKFLDGSFLEAIIRRRCTDKIPFGGKATISWLLANAITDRYQTDRERVVALQRWVCVKVPHVYAGNWKGRPTYFRIHALDLLAAPCAHCVPTAEILATLAWHAGYPARTLGIRRNVQPLRGHCVNEVFLEGKWCFIDADFLRCFEMEDGTLASAAELSERRDIVDRAEEDWAKKEWDGEFAFLKDWKFLDDRGRPTYSEYFHHLYFQEGVYSLDGFYGSWIKYGAETADYLYGGTSIEMYRRMIAARDFWACNDEDLVAEPGTERWKEMEERMEADWVIPSEPPGWMIR